MSFNRTLQRTSRLFRFPGRFDVSGTSFREKSDWCKCDRDAGIYSTYHHHQRRNQIILHRDYSAVSGQLHDPLTPVKSRYFQTSKTFSKDSPNLGTIHKEDAPLTKSQADDLILRLTEEERKALLAALQEYNSNQVKTEYEAEKVPLPTGHQLLRVGIFNAVPFVGFGFLDNFVMIVAGDYIDETLGSLVTISTMAAAALGNTISDVMGIGSAWYVELAASKVGLKPPNLSPIQLDMKPARRAANLGRAMGIVVGCLLGMLPLLFISKEDVKKKEKA